MDAEQAAKVIEAAIQEHADMGVLETDTPYGDLIEAMEMALRVLEAAGKVRAAYEERYGQIIIDETRSPQGLKFPRDVDTKNVRP